MYLYVHEFKNPGDSKQKEIKNTLLENSIKDYQTKKGLKQKKLKIETTKHGKPFLAKTKKLHFSISHSGRFWTCIFDEENIGLDIEDYALRNMPITRFMEITDRYYKPDEKEFVLGNHNKDAPKSDMDEELKSRFFRIWTAKEAYMKYTGNGFTEGFKNFSVLDDSLELYFRDVHIDPQVMLTFCSRQDKNLDELINI